MYSIFVYLYICCYCSHTPDGVLRIKKVSSFQVSSYHLSEFYLTGCSLAGYDYDVATQTCLKLFYIPTPKTWTDARSYCQNDGGDLISITNTQKRDFVIRYVNCK